MVLDAGLDGLETADCTKEHLETSQALGCPRWFTKILRVARLCYRCTRKS